MGIREIMSGFVNGSGKTAEQQQMQPTQPAQAQAVSTATGVHSAGEVSAIPPTAVGDKSPLANYDKLWEADASIKPVAHSVAMTFDKGKVSAAVQHIDYMKELPAELIAKATSGDTAAMMEVINRTGQTALTNATQVTTDIVNQALDRQAEHYRTTVIPDVLRGNAVRTAIRADNPIFEHPAVKPMLSMAENQLIAKHPQATPAEITAMAKDMTSEFAQAIADSQGKVMIDKPVVKESDKPFNWESWATQPAS